MKNLRQAIVSLVAAVAFTSLAVLAPASPAAAADAECTLSPKSVTVYDTPKTVKFAVKSDFQYWAVDLTNDGRLDADDETPKATLSYRDFYPANAGKRLATVALLNDEGDVSICEPTYSLLQGSAVSIAVRKVGTKRQVSGTLKQITFGNVKPWSASVGQKVAVQYRAKGGQWVTTATVKTQAGGKFKVTKKLGKRPWRVVYTGTATVGARTSKTITG